MKLLLSTLFLACCGTAFAQLENASTPRSNELGNAIRQTTINTSNAVISKKISLDFYNNPTVTLTNVVSRPVLNATVAKGVILPTAFEPTVHIGLEQKQAIAFVQIPQYIQQSNGAILQLENYELQVANGTPIKSTRGQRVYAANSVLSSGTWHKIAVDKRGVYKVDFNFVKNSLGIDPSTITPSNIAVFGNGGTLVPENNLTPRPDDLTQNPIQLVGMQDGVFNDGDYFLFYANGPFEIVNDSINKQFHQIINIYSSDAYYFLNFNTSNALRIAAQNTSGLGSPTAIVNTCNEFTYHHRDSSNIGKFGKRWWGEQFGNRISTSLNRTFTFSLPSIDAAAPLYIYSPLSCRSVGAPCNMQVSVNGVISANLGFPSIGPEYYEPAYATADFAYTLPVATPSLQIAYKFSPGQDNSLAYLDYIEVNGRRQLNYGGTQQIIADWNSVAPAAIAQFALSNTNSNVQVWNITNALAPINMQLQNASSTSNFSNYANRLHSYVAFEPSNAFTPRYAGKVSNQNLHALTQADYIIVAHPNFLPQAKQLAAHHAYKRGLSSAVVTTTEVYNEFGSGAQDISAIRDFAKMFYDKATSQATLPKYLLLFGDASYDYKDRISDNTNFIPSRETDESSDKIIGHCSDDFFGMLDDIENINAAMVNTLDIGVGRLPAQDENEANTFVQKIKIYDSSISYGAWRNNVTYCTDNGDGALHAVDGEIMSKITADSVPRLNQYKVYVDAFPLESSPGGFRAPQAKQSLDALLYNGTLVVNYNGHGGPAAWCDERIFTNGDITSYNNLYKMPLYITATCDFGPFNDPGTKSGAEKLLNYNKGGAIALMTTTQLVFQYENRIMNSDYWRSGFVPMPNGKMPALGDAFRISKNKTYANTWGDLSNFRKFALLGDPALQLAFPKLAVQADSLNGVSIASGLHDTIKALGVYKLSGTINDAQGNVQAGFNGEAVITIFDKQKQLSTLGNNAASPKLLYKLQNAVVFSGRATVVNGKWQVTFRAPKDIDYNYGFGKISMYAYNQTIDGAGYNNKVVIGGGAGATLNDNEGPIIKPYMNDRKFVNGGMTGSNSTLIADLSDENGINTSGAGIGHDITAVLDGKTDEPIVLNNYYAGAKDNYKAGTVTYPFKNLSPGKHTMVIKAWDVLNNSGTATLDFVVHASDKPQLENVFNVPNPFTTNTKFTFEHNFPNEPLYVTIQVYSVSGQMVKSIRQLVQSEGTRAEIDWNGLDEIGDKIGRGVYLYKVYYKTLAGKSASKYEKLLKL